MIASVAHQSFYHFMLHRISSPLVIPIPYASQCVLFEPIETQSLFRHHEISKYLVNELDDLQAL